MPTKEKAKPKRKKAEKPKLPEAAELHKLECAACPLNTVDIMSPKMLATGAKKPLIYVLGEAPGKEEDFKGMQFVGRAGQLLRRYIKKDWWPLIRWQNTIRCWPGEGNPTPTFLNIECCRPSIERDIAKAKPTAIFGFGSVPLNWIMPGMTIGAWRGRKMPVTIGGHTCWYFPFHHPSYINRVKEDSFWGQEEERAFKFDIHRALRVVEDLPAPQPHTAEMARQNVEWVDGSKPGDAKRVVEAINSFAKMHHCGLDYETQGTRPYAKTASILSIGLGTVGHGFAFAFDHPKVKWKPTDLEMIRAAFVDFLKSSCIKVVHGLSFEMEWTAFFFGRKLLRAGPWADTMSMAFTLDERKGGGRPGAFALQFLVWQYFGFDLKGLSKVDLKNMQDVPLVNMLPYNAMDAKYHCGLYERMLPEIETKKLLPVYELHLRRVPTCVLTQLKGVPVNQKVVKRLQTKYSKRIKDREEEIYRQRVIREFEADRKDSGKFRKEDWRFNPGSNPQLVTIFRDILGRKEGYRQRKRGQGETYSVDEETLAKIRHPLANLIVSYRKAVKQKSTYIDPLATGSDILFPDGLLHPQLHTTYVVTGRLSSSDPNEQNFPHRDSEGQEVRGQVEAPNGHVICSIDLGQIEARVMAMASKDKTYMDMLWDDYDTHMDWTIRVAKAYPPRLALHKAAPDPLKAFRTDIKNQWTFPLFYGATLKSVMSYLGIPESALDKIEPLYNAFWREFKGIKRWQERQLEQYERYGYIKCLTGRRLRAPLRLNQVYNEPIQGTAADICLDAMNRLSELTDSTGNWYYQPIMQIHDDLTFIWPADKLDRYLEKALSIILFPQFDFINVPITAEVSVGRDWANQEKVGTFYSNKW